MSSIFLAQASPQGYQAPTPKAYVPPTPRAQRPSWEEPQAPAETPPADTLKIPASRPEVLVFMKAQGEYVKFFEMSRTGELSFGTGYTAKEFSSFLQEALQSQLGGVCPVTSVGGSEAFEAKQSAQLTAVTKTLEQNIRTNHFALGGLLFLTAILILSFVLNRTR